MGKGSRFSLTSVVRVHLEAGWVVTAAGTAFLVLLHYFLKYEPHYEMDPSSCRIVQLVGLLCLSLIIPLVLIERDDEQLQLTVPVGLRLQLFAKGLAAFFLLLASLSALLLLTPVRNGNIPMPIVVLMLPTLAYNIIVCIGAALLEKKLMARFGVLVGWFIISMGASIVAASPYACFKEEILFEFYPNGPYYTPLAVLSLLLASLATIYRADSILSRRNRRWISHLQATGFLILLPLLYFSNVHLFRFMGPTKMDSWKWPMGSRYVMLMNRSVLFPQLVENLYYDRIAGEWIRIKSVKNWDQLAYTWMIHIALPDGRVLDQIVDPADDYVSHLRLTGETTTDLPIRGLIKTEYFFEDCRWETYVTGENLLAGTGEVEVSIAPILAPEEVRHYRFVPARRKNIMLRSAIVPLRKGAAVFRYEAGNNFISAYFVPIEGLGARCLNIPGKVGKVPRENIKIFAGRFCHMFNLGLAEGAEEHLLADPEQDALFSLGGFAPAVSDGKVLTSWQSTGEQGLAIRHYAIQPEFSTEPVAEFHIGDVSVDLGRLPIYGLFIKDRFLYSFFDPSTPILDIGINGEEVGHARMDPSRRLLLVFGEKGSITAADLEAKTTYPIPYPPISSEPWEIDVLDYRPGERLLRLLVNYQVLDYRFDQGRWEVYSP